MTLCHNCDNTRDEYISNGVQKEYSITFEYYEKEDVAVAFWNTFALGWDPIPNASWVFVHDTLIRFNEAPPFDQRFIIYRCTDVNQLPAEFYPGSTIKAQDLNNNFFVLKSAIEEAKCAVSTSEGALDERDWNKTTDTISETEQTSGEAQVDEEHIFSAAGIAARLDSYVQASTPTPLTYEQPGKIWNDTDDLVDYFWDSNVGTWVSFTKSGPAGPKGGFGPPGKVIISDEPPTQYPIVGTDETRELQNGDLWFDSYHVLMFVYYVDSNGPGQWVSVSKTGPQGPAGDGGVPEAPIDNLIYGRKDAAWVEVAGSGNDPTQSILLSAINGTLTLQPGGDTTVIPTATESVAGLFSAADKTILDNLVASPGGVVSLVPGDGIAVNTAQAPGTAGTPEVSVKFAGSGANETTLVIPANVQLLTDLP
tara:strand:+ start:1203 stop:2471 length:1269 start_codon:yes stop_codon:yes gene_type:complete